MANDVFANGREISCKSGAGKTICAFPDVCFTPPENPVTPPGVPIPYPNTGMASDTTSGSKKVKISDKEVMLKNKSYFKKSMGDEAGCAAKKGIITSVNRGKIYFVAWSMDVKIEGENAVRHLDMTTHNHASPLANEAVPWPFVDSQALEPGGVCHEDAEKEKEACKDYKPHGENDVCPTEVGGVAVSDLSQKKKHEPAYVAMAEEGKKGCLAARKCQLVPYKKEPNEPGVDSCCPGQTGDHVIDDANVRDLPNYSHSAAPVICAAGPNQWWASHGRSHSIKGHFAKCYKRKHGTKTMPYSALRKTSATAVKLVFHASGCSKACLEAQLDGYFKNEKKPILEDSTQLKGSATGRTGQSTSKALLKTMVGER